MLYTLPSLTCLAVTGDKACEFLQGQLTADITQVSETRMTPAALCNLQGRIIALIDVLTWNHQFLLIYPTDLHPAIQKALSLAARLSRVHLTPVPSLYCYGLFYPDAHKLLPQENNQCSHTPDLTYYKVTDALFMILCHSPEALTHLPFLPAPVHDELAWHQHLLHQQRIRIYPETSGRFLPNRLTLDALGYVSFQKGCYKGQEIIARLHYRSQQRYCLQSLTIPTPTTPLMPGDVYRDPVTQEAVGDIVDLVPQNDTHLELLLSVRMA